MPLDLPQRVPLTPDEIELKKFHDSQKSEADRRRRKFKEDELKYRQQRDIEDRIAAQEVRGQESKRIRVSERAQRISEIRTTMDTIDWLKPVLVVVGVIILVFGFGIPSLLAIFEAMNWYYWALALLIGLIIWRSY